GFCCIGSMTAVSEGICILTISEGGCNSESSSSNTPLVKYIYCPGFAICLELPVLYMLYLNPSSVIPSTLGLPEDPLLHPTATAMAIIKRENILIRLFVYIC